MYSHDYNVSGENGRAWGIQRNRPLIVQLLCVRERICFTQSCFCDIKESPHALQKSEFTGNWGFVPAIIQNYPHPSEHQNKGGKKRERKRGRNGKRRLYSSQTQTPAESVFQAPVILAGGISWDCSRKVKCQALSCNNPGTMCGVKENVPGTTMNTQCDNCTSEVSWILARNQQSKTRSTSSRRA